MRLLFLQASSLLDHFGGVEYYQHDLISLLCEQLGPENVRTVIPERKIAKNEAPFHYEVTRLPFPKTKWLSKLSNRLHPSYFTETLPLIRGWKPDWIICGHASLGPIAWMVSRLTQVPYASLLYGIECWGNMYPQDEWALKHADHLVSISRWTQSVLLKRGYDEKEFSIVHPTVSSEFSHLPPPDPSFDLTSPLRLLTISRLDASEKYKGQDDTLQALKILRNRRPDLRLSYTIQGNGDDLPRLRSLVSLLQLKDMVQFKKSVVSRSELLQSYRNADLFIMPSHFEEKEGKWNGEGFGIVYVEAGLCGVPSIAYQCGGVTDIVIDEKTGYLAPPHRIECLADRIEFLADHRDALEKMRLATYQHMKNYFSRDAIRKEVGGLAQRLEARTVSQTLPSISSIPDQY